MKLISDEEFDGIGTEDFPANFLCDAVFVDEKDAKKTLTGNFLLHFNDTNATDFYIH